jgi:thiamine kinase-like enzyme
VDLDTDPRHVRPLADGTDSLPDLVLRGWDLFASHAPADVAEVVLAVLADPQLLARPLAARPMTLIHGDLSLANIAVERDQMTLLDWGLAAIAPPAVELASFLIDHISQVDASHEQIIGDFQEESGDLADPVALKLALLAGLVELGWHKALNATAHPDPAFQAAERKDLEWWFQRAREAAPVL